MSQTSNRRRQGPFPALPVIGLLFRLSLATSFLYSGLMIYLTQRFVTARGMPLNYNPYMPQSFANALGNVPGLEPLKLLLGPLQIGIGVALALGFFTAWAAALAGFVLIIPSLTHIVLMMNAAGMPGDPNAIMTMALSGASQNLTSERVFLAAAVIWLAASGYNPMSLDALIFKRSRTLEARVGYPAPVEFQDSVPASVPKGLLAREFDPSMAVTEQLDS